MSAHPAADQSALDLVRDMILQRAIAVGLLTADACEAQTRAAIENVLDRENLGVLRELLADLEAFAA